MALNVNETRRHHQPAGINPFACRGLLQHTRWRDAGDAIAANGQVAVEPGVSATVHNAPAENDHVERSFIPWRI
jgi:hypothetical protein